jgi:hypothetical protein
VGILNATSQTLKSPIEPREEEMMTAKAVLAAMHHQEEFLNTCALDSVVGRTD